MYLSASNMQALLGEIQKRFGFCTFVFDAYTPLAAKVPGYKNPINRVQAKINFAMDDPHIPETEHIRFHSEHSMLYPEILQKLSAVARLRYRFMGKHFRKFYRMYTYTINLWP